MVAPEPDAPLTMFTIVREASPPDVPTRVRIELPEDVDLRGPGEQPPATEGKAPDWWQREAEALLLTLAARPEGVTADDLRERFPHPASASNAAVGSLFRRLAADDLIRLIGYEQSRRPSSRGRVLGRWVAQ